jgi:hypothetical protein
MWSTPGCVAVGTRRDIDQGPDRSISLGAENKACPKLGDASPNAHVAASAPFQHQDNIILVNPKVVLSRNMAIFAPQYATF